MTPAELNALADRIETAEGPSRELDAEIAVAASPDKDARIVWGKGCRFYRKPGDGRVPFAGAFGKGVHLGLIYQSRRFTASIEAALTLVPEGLGWSLCRGRDTLDGGYFCRLWGDAQFKARSATAALALCAAALRAMAAQ